MADLVCGHEGANMDVRKLHNAKALEGLGQPSESDTSLGNLESDPLEDKAVGGGREWQGTHRGGGLLEKATTAWRGRVEGKFTRLSNGARRHRKNIQAPVNPQGPSRGTINGPANHN